MKKLLLILLILTAAGCSNEKLKPVIDSSFDVKRVPAQESWNSSIVFSDSGKTKAVVFADHIMMYEDETDETLLEEVKIDFYDENEVKRTTLTSKYGHVDNRTRDMVARQEVVAVNDSGMTLKTNELFYRNMDRKIYTDKFVTIINKKEKIQGYGLEADQDLSSYVIFNITYITSVKEGDTPVAE